MRTLKEVMESGSLAVVGASLDPFKPGAILLKTLIDTGFKGKIAGVNPKGGSVNGVSLYSSLDKIPFDVDLAVMLIPPPLVPNAVHECAKKGVKGVVISSEGFAESGEQGRHYQDEISKILQSSGMRGFGPNTLGIINTSSGLTTSYFTDENMLLPGGVGFVSQSGIFVGALLRYIGSLESLGISKGIGLGNKIDVDESDVLQYFLEDDQTRTIGMYIEDIRNGAKFIKSAKQATPKKPVLLLKGGQTVEGSRASASHTASLAVNNAVLNGALQQSGILRMNGIEEMINTLMGFEWMPLPKGNNIAIVTFSGAQAIMSVDAAVKNNVSIAKFSKKTAEALSHVIATPSKAYNPIDIFPDMMVHGFDKISMEILKALFEDKGVHGIVFISFAVSGAEPFHLLSEFISENRSKPVFVSLLGAKEDTRSTSDYLLKQKIPCVAYPEMAIQAFSHMWSYAKRRMPSQ
ncbi:MAG: CoA-binding protein [Deltaproteobacteria bacterium]|nr:CoA-binding protein [Deltaproteobacteria bacterium]MBW2179707.1 CoA-binding protein [Deltaproteobacteria bacterium]